LSTTSTEIHPHGDPWPRWKKPHENFTKTAKEELAKFERKEIEFQKMERNQRATQLNLPMPKNDRRPYLP